MQSRSRWLILVGVILAVLLLLLKLAGTYTDYLWFASLSYQSVFLKILFARILVGLFFGVILFLILWPNLRYAIGRRGLVPYLPPPSEWSPFDAAKLEKYVNWGLVGAVILISVIGGISGAGKGMELLRFIGGQPFGINDPVFHRDLSLYVFKLPLLKYCLNFLAFSIVLAGVWCALIYGLREEIAVREGELTASPQARHHLFFLVGIVLVFKAVGYWLGTYGLLFSERGVVFGAAYTDLKARLPVLYILAVLALVVAALWLLPRKGESRERVGLTALIVLVAASFLGWTVYPMIMQKFFVSPNEIVKERTYIERNIKFTRAAFGLTQVQGQPFGFVPSLSRDDLNNNRPTIANIRLWDQRPLPITYRQLQSIRTYYMFTGADTDRYVIDGALTQVMLAARELDFQALPEEARRWVNQRLLWTHGYGLVMSLANAVTSEGRPDFLIKDIPPVTRGIPVTRPEVYYGEVGSSPDQQLPPAAAPSPGQPGPARGPLSFGRPAPPSAGRPADDYVIVETKENEVDYPLPTPTAENDNALARHKGTGGVLIGSILRRLAFAIRFVRVDIAITPTITKESRIVFNRNVLDRVQTLAPFLRFDADPYLVVADGSLYWLVDGYTKTDRYPYSQRYADTNYIRNSVKAVVNAYSGATDLYVFDPADPLIRTYQKLFPALFKPKEEMPPSLMQHIRYPKGLFSLQAEVLNTYHMQNPRVLYNREDRWNLAQEPSYTSADGGSAGTPVEPYYMVMKLPGQTSEEFILLVPFTPFSTPDSQTRKDNMIAWMAARCGPENYGQLTLFELPKDQVIYGPKQIGGLIDQDPEISAAFTLWGQRGSSVIRGHLLVIPIEHSFLYVQPIYLQAAEGAIPELKRVIVAFGDRLAMKETLQGALEAVLGTAKVPAAIAPSPAVAPPEPGAAPQPTPATPTGIEQLLRQAEEQLRRTEEASRKTQEELNSLKDILSKIRGQSARP